MLRACFGTAHVYHAAVLRLVQVTAERQEAATKLASMRAELEAERVSTHKAAESHRAEVEAVQMQVGRRHVTGSNCRAAFHGILFFGALC